MTVREIKQLFSVSDSVIYAVKKEMMDGKG
jgi:hypothetical protein